MPYGNQCRFCLRPIDLPIGDTCSRCEERLNATRETLEFARQQWSSPPCDVASYFEGCTLTLREYHLPVTRIEWGWHATEERVRADIEIFFTHKDRIQLERLTWEGKPRK